uniref:Tyr recombinase domain-containing protein n=1 Tax=Anoplophora glabripennis TaxID=217634 RepID=V5GSG8_ANOGL
MIKSTIFIEENVDISKYPKLRAFLKRKNDGYTPKKSNVFTREQVNDFLVQAPDNTYLLMKVVTVLGIAGACRSDELCKLTLDVNFKNFDDIIVVTIPDSKNGMSRTFTITSRLGSVSHLEILKKYIKIRLEIKTEISRFFMRYQAGRCYNQPVGKNTLSMIPNKIAQFLKLEHPETYTGHSFRRTSATLLANTGVDVLAIKRHGGWKSATIAESYVADSLSNKNEIANRILYNDTSTPGSSSTSHHAVLMDQSDNIEPPVTEMERSNHFEKNVTISKREGNNYPDFINVTKCNNCTITINIHS